MQTQENIVALSPAKPIDVRRLEKELTAMWAGTIAPAEQGGATAMGITRACVLNLIVYASQLEGRESIDAMLDEVIGRHPCRALVLLIDREAAQAKLEAYVSTRCQLSSKGAKQICGEQVTIEASGQVVQTVATAVAPLLIPDVPVFLWWKDIPNRDDVLFKRLVAMADRVVIDSACFDHPYDDFLHLAAMLREQPQTMHVSDLNWGRLRTWRTLVASFWDVTDYRFFLDHLDRVVVTYEKSKSSHDTLMLRALLMVGWVAAQLGYEVETSTRAEVDGGDTRFTLRAGERMVSVEVRAVDAQPAIDPMMISILLSVANGDAEFNVELKPERTKLVTGVKIGDSEHSIGRVLTYEARSEGQRLSSELDFLTRDVIYEKAVALSARLIETTQIASSGSQ